ncbi:outer membrane lipoprotein-sorting protein [Marinigracilibium pacificum]|uniref:Outer membrane lipoprotein-sorting protein n=1 Tax=Marinigracilibium pacificum TaxID=2729599 RepID=A0A848IV56_9BACT|nr:outer membrane lipoprotein-sorting protein [Marinigracilibium pacificum]NMM48217.1 outer membrane lipoprotein-sorting protein [Marinigracilibium pacificum]
MYTILLLIKLIVIAGFQTSNPDAAEILKKVDENLVSDNRITTSRMVIRGKRTERIIAAKSYIKGTEDTYTVYLSPEREKGTKMLKLSDKLWIYSPSTDRIIQISGHMLRQSVMGSDLSYEDMMDNTKLLDAYDPKIIKEETIDSRSCWVIELIAKSSDVSYQKRLLWVDQEKYIPLKEELYAKGGQLLKRITLSDIREVDGRTFPFKMNFKDMLKDGEGTDFIIDDLSFNKEIPEEYFNKSVLKK